MDPFHPNITRPVGRTRHRWGFSGKGLSWEVIPSYYSTSEWILCSSSELLSERRITAEQSTLYAVSVSNLWRNAAQLPAASDLETNCTLLVNFPSEESNAFTMTLSERLSTHLLCCRDMKGKSLGRVFRSAPQTFPRVSIRLQMTNRPRSSSGGWIGPAGRVWRRRRRRRRRLSLLWFHWCLLNFRVGEEEGSLLRGVHRRGKGKQHHQEMNHFVLWFLEIFLYPTKPAIYSWNNQTSLTLTGSFLEVNEPPWMKYSYLTMLRSLQTKQRNPHCCFQAFLLP